MTVVYDGELRPWHFIYVYDSLTPPQQTSSIAALKAREDCSEPQDLLPSRSADICY